MSMGIASVLAVSVAFVAVVVWAFHPANAERFEQDAKIPLEAEPEAGADSQ